eukprot:790947-Ditylum_brightwellii.AAC.1
MRSQPQRCVSSQDLEKTAGIQISSSFSRPPKPPTEVQPGPSDLPEPFAGIESNQRNIPSEGSLNQVSKSESETDVSMRSQQQRQVSSLDSKKMANRGRSSSMSRSPKLLTEAQSNAETSKSFPDVEISSIDDSVEVSQ